MFHLIMKLKILSSSTNARIGKTLFLYCVFFTSDAMLTCLPSWFLFLIIRIWKACLFFIEEFAWWNGGVQVRAHD